MSPNRKWKIFKVAAGKLWFRVSLPPDKISAKFHRLYLFFGVQHSIETHENWECYETIPEVEKSKMATSQLQMRVFALSDKISTEIQRLYLRFWGPAFHWNLWEWCATKPEVGSTKCSANARLLDLFTGYDTHMITKFWSTNTTVHMCIWSSEIVIFSTSGSGARNPP